MKPVRITSPGAPGWLALRMALWPAALEEHLSDMADFVRDPRQAAFLLHDEAGVAVGLVEASVRHDYVNGTESSPVGYLEGIYVAPPWRWRGLARLLVDHAMHWAARKGCTEFASDAPSTMRTAAPCTGRWDSRKPSRLCTSSNPSLRRQPLRAMPKA